MGTTTENQIRIIFDRFSGHQVERVKKTKDYAFVHFATRDAAEKAMTAVQQTEDDGENIFTIDGMKVEVSWSRPVDKHIYNQRKHLTKVLTSPYQPTAYSSDCPGDTNIPRNGEQFYVGQ